MSSSRSDRLRNTILVSFVKSKVGSRPSLLSILAPTCCSVTQRGEANETLIMQYKIPTCARCATRNCVSTIVAQLFIQYIGVRRKVEDECHKGSARAQCSKLDRQ